MACRAVADWRRRIGHRGIAPRISVWKTGVYLSTLMPVERESRAGVAPAFAVLQTAAWAARPTGREVKVRAETSASARVVPGVLEPFAIRERSTSGPSKIDRKVKSEPGRFAVASTPPRDRIELIAKC